MQERILLLAPQAFAIMFKQSEWENQAYSKWNGFSLGEPTKPIELVSMDDDRHVSIEDDERLHPGRGCTNPHSQQLYQYAPEFLLHYLFSGPKCKLDL